MPVYYVRKLMHSCSIMCPFWKQPTALWSNSHLCYFKVLLILGYCFSKVVKPLVVAISSSIYLPVIKHGVLENGPQK